MQAELKDGSRQVSRNNRGEAAKRIADATPPVGKGVPRGPLLSNRDPAGAVVSVPGDRDDEVVLATLLAAKADWLVTGDAALLALAGRYPIATPAEFGARHLL